MSDWFRNTLDLQDLIATSNFKKSGDLKDLAVVSTNAVLRRRMEARDAKLAEMESRWSSTTRDPVQPGDFLRDCILLAVLPFLCLAFFYVGVWILGVVVPAVFGFLF